MLETDRYELKRYGDLTTLNVPARRWVSMEIDVIVGLPRTRSRFDSINTWSDRLLQQLKSSN